MADGIVQDGQQKPAWLEYGITRPWPGPRTKRVCLSCDEAPDFLIDCEVWACSKHYDEAQREMQRRYPDQRMHAVVYLHEW